MRSESPDLLEHLLDAIKSVRPDILTGGQPDLTKLRAALKPRYGLIWEDQPEHEVDTAEKQGKHPLLKLKTNNSLTLHAEGPVHALIEGDNYHALKVLNYTHARKVDVIYIDPPYNTGNKDFRYNDNFVEKDDGFRHSKWLSFMAKRLHLAKSLLKDTGVIFISIDENEFAQLKMLCDDVFKEQNYIANFIWTKKRKASNLDSHVRVLTEYVLCYAKNYKELPPLSSPLDVSTEETKPYPFYNTGNKRKVLVFPKNWVKFTGVADGVIPRGSYPDKKTRVELLDDICVVNGVATNEFRMEGEWRYGQQTLDTFAQNNESVEIKGNKLKPYWINKNERVKKVKTLLNDDYDIGTNEDAESELFNLFGEKVFDFPKPTSLIKFLISLVPAKDALVLDFFAGSGTTAHAVMQLNAEDGGMRKCILITNDEGEFKNECGEVLPGGICTHVTRPRLSRVIEGYVTSKGVEVPGLEQNLLYLKTSMYAPKTDLRGVYVEYKQFLIEAIDLLRFKEAAPLENKPYYAGDKNTWDEEAPWGVYTSLDGSKTLVVLLDEDAVESCVEYVATLQGDVSLYPFTYEDDTSAQELCHERGFSHVTVHPVPGNLLKTYRRLNRK